MANIYYPQIGVALVTDEGVFVPLRSENVEYYNITQAITIDTIATDSNGLLPAGYFDSGVDPVAVGDVVELRHGTYTGTARFTLQATAEDAVNAVENNIATLVLENNYTTKTPDIAAIFAQDLDEPNAAPVFLGNAKLGVVTPLPLQSSVSKNLRLYVAGSHKDDQFTIAALEKLDSYDLSVPGLGGGGVESLFDFYSDQTTAGTSEESLYDGLVEAGQLAANGDKIEAFFHGDLAANAHTKEINCYVAGMLVGGISTTQSGKPWLFDIEIIRVSNSVLRVSLDMMVSNSPLAGYAEVTGLDLANDDITIQIKATTGAAAGDVTARMGNAVYFPAAPVSAVDYLLSEDGEYLFSEGGSALTAE